MNLTDCDQTIESILLQADDQEAQRLFDELMRNSARIGLLRALETEVDMLCGPKYKPVEDQEFRRAGSEKGVAYINGEKTEINRPRVRTADNENSEEIRLETYRLASDQNNLFGLIKDAVAAGASMRGIGKCHGGAVKKSQASEMWIEASLEVFHEYRTRSLLSEDWVALMLDGVSLGRDKCAIVAIGIRADGTKQTLDFEVGASENATTCTALLERIVERGFGPPPDQRLLVLADGAKALKKATLKLWPDAVYQECLVHAERVTLGKLAKKYHEEVVVLFKNLRNAQGETDSEESFDELCEGVKQRNAKAGEDLEVRKDALLAFQRLGVPSTLNTTFLSTNLIENVFRNFRTHTKGIKRWQDDKMINRWVATGLLKAEEGFRKVSGHKDIPILLEKLKAQKS